MIFAVACIAGVIYLTKFYFEQKEQQLRDQIRNEQKLTRVVVAKRNLAIGDPINLETMTIKHIPFEYVPDGAIVPDQYAAVEFKHLQDPMTAGKPLLRQFVEGVSRIARFSDLLSEGERAITLEVDGVSSIEHMIESGDFIDLAVRKSKGQEIELLLERVKVLSTGKFTTADPKFPGMYKTAQYPTITLGVPSETVRDVFAADGAGDLVFLLRNRRDEMKPRYELTDSERNTVTVYQAGNEDNGVLVAKVEKASVNAVQNNSAKIVRNSNGRLAQIARDIPISIVAGQEESIPGRVIDESL
ncbi:Flp pilus assembly protein CpaB [Microbulbifer bruguierae]|uniref:Flp pilus assembly protein CpaB n=1 Tax=Microbulbifer bruguierae TaxID=3029061 RepID=A0ABY8NDB3_9GAMM|nr:Flp pilus assembly protein CpaB [Microbulbifer bruguierae]WGL15423.1 Flp pilus assembly protein CpaB [Microbulbifer bruguierae]